MPIVTENQIGNTLPHYIWLPAPSSPIDVLANPAFDQLPGPATRLTSTKSTEIAHPFKLIKAAAVIPPISAASHDMRTKTLLNRANNLAQHGTVWVRIGRQVTS